MEGFIPSSHIFFFITYARLLLTLDCHPKMKTSLASCDSKFASWLVRRSKTFPKVETFWTVYRFLILCCWTCDLYLFSLINVGRDVRTVQLSWSWGSLNRFLTEFFPYCFFTGLRSFEYSWTSLHNGHFRGQKKVRPLKRGGRRRGAETRVNAWTVRQKLTFVESWPGLEEVRL